MADFYKSVFDLQEVWRDKDSRVVYLTDGVMNLALLPPPSEGGEDQKLGINHFGFLIEDLEEIQRRLELADVPGATQRPQDGRRYAEFRAADPEGNWFDLAEKGWTTEAPPPAVE
jgi:catechol 2,3-dioxygenase-like lactoylglutathione lyase family enzyme